MKKILDGIEKQETKNIVIGLDLVGFTAIIIGYSTNECLEDSWDTLIGSLQQKLKSHDKIFY